MVIKISEGRKAQPPPGFPEWLESDIVITNGHDPLGLESIATYGVLPRVLPGILALSRRARYFSFHTFLLDEFRRRRVGTTQKELDLFIRHCECEYGYAVTQCRQCGWDAPGILGAINLRQVRHDDAPRLRRALSIKTPMGGYGLFYASPLMFLGVVAPKGSEDSARIKIQHDCVANERGRELANSFRTAIADTAWYKRWIGGDAPIPKEALAELAEAACLCRLPASSAEHRLIQTILFERDQPDEDHRLEAEQRRSSMALTLSAIDDSPAAANEVSAWRRTLWKFSRGLARAEPQSNARSETAAQWGAVVGREYQQAGLSAIWYTVCEIGNRQQPFGGFSHEAFEAVMRKNLIPRHQVFGLDPPAPDAATSAHGEALKLGLSHRDLEELLADLLANPSALAGLGFLLELRRRMPSVEAMPAGWRSIGDVDGSHQEGLLGFMRWFDRHLSSGPTVIESLVTIARRFVIARHERIAATKLPRFTFRFRREAGRLRFFPDRRAVAFGAGAPRWEPLMLIGRDLGYWKDGRDSPRLTQAGKRFVRETFSAP